MKSETLDKVADMTKVLLVFVMLTIIFYGLIVWVTDQLDSRYQDGPHGKSVKVYDMSVENGMRNISDVQHRLQFFYWYGE